MTRPVLIHEPLYGGHHFQYVRVLVEGLLSLGQPVALALAPGASDRDEFKVHLGDLLGDVQLTRTVAGPTPPSFKQWRRVAADLIKITGELRPRRVILPYTGGVPAGLGSRRWPWPFDDIPLEGLVMRGAWAYPAGSTKARLQTQLNLRLLLRVPWQRLHILDPLAYFGLTRALGRIPETFRLIPEPVETIAPVPPAQARAQLGLPAEGRWAVVTGAQDERKGSDRLLAAFAAADLPEDARLLLAGRVSEGVRRWLNDHGERWTASGRVCLIDRYLTDQEHDLALNSADFVVAPHVRAVGSSGLLVRAAALRKPVLASNFGWIGWATATFGLGRTVDVENPAAYRDAVSTLYRSPPAHSGAGPDRFAQYHTQANQTAHLLELTATEAHAQTASQPLRWEQVFADVPPPDGHTVRF